MDERRARFEQLYDATSHLILGYALRRTDGAEDAADVVAEVFLVAWRRLDDVPAGDEARLWLYGVARNVLANHSRALRRRDRLTSQVRDEVAVFARGMRPAGEGRDRTAILAALAALGDVDREVLGLVGWEGLDHEQAAAVLGCSRPGLRVRLHRARRRFGRELAARGIAVPTRSGRPGHEPNGWALADPDKEGVT